MEVGRVLVAHHMSPETGKLLKLLVETSSRNFFGVRSGFFRSNQVSICRYKNHQLKYQTVPALKAKVYIK